MGAAPGNEMREKEVERGLSLGEGSRNHGGSFLQAVFEAFEDGAGVIRGFLEGFKDAVAHVKRRLESSFFAAILAVGEVLGELIPLAADAETPALEGSGFVCVAGDIALSHDCVFWVVENGGKHPRGVRMPDKSV